MVEPPATRFSVKVSAPEPTEALRGYADQRLHGQRGVLTRQRSNICRRFRHLSSPGSQIKKAALATQLSDHALLKHILCHMSRDDTICCVLVDCAVSLPRVLTFPRMECAFSKSVCLFE